MERRPIVTTFYSYKGGVGRTQSLANVAVYLANQGHDVVVVDLDLESPGLHYYFSPPDKLGRQFLDQDLAEREGLIDFLEVCAAGPVQEPQIGPLLMDCGHRFQHKGRLRILGAGRLDDDYPRRVAEFSWERFYEQENGYPFMELMREQLLASGADFILLDSRTGMTDVGSVCTFQLPEVVVILFALHMQGIEGAARVKAAIEQQQRTMPEGASRLEKVLLLPARVDEWGATNLLDVWIKRVREFLDDDSPEIELLLHHDDRIPYLAQVAFGEQVIMDPSAEPNDLSRAYQRLTNKLEDVAAKAGAVEPEAEPKAARHLRAIDEGTAALGRLVGDLTRAVSAHDPSTQSLAAVANWAHRIGSTQSLLREELRRLETSIQWLHEDCRHLPAPGLSGQPDTVPAWQEMLETVAARAEAARQTWQSIRRRELREQLGRAAHRDQRLVDRAMASLEELLAVGNTVEIEDKLPELEATLRRDSMSGMLERNQLDRSLLAERLPDVSSQRAWLAQRLQSFLESGSIGDPHARPLLWNILRLRIELSERLTHNDWAAYELLCLLTSSVGDADESIRCFRDIGTALWLDAWRAVLDPDDSASDLLAGPDSRQQLRDIAAGEPELLEPLIQKISAGLETRWHAGDQNLLTRLLRDHRDDPVLDRALRHLGAQHALAPELRAGLLALRLTGAAPIPSGLAAVFLRTLIASEQPAEAFYAMCALVRIDVLPLDTYAALIADVLVSYVVALMAGTNTRQAGLALLMEGDIQIRMQQSRAGCGFLAGLGGRLFKDNWPEDLGSFARVALLHQGGGLNSLPEPVAERLRMLETGGGIDEAAAERVESLLNEIGEKSAKGIYSGWGGSMYYNRAFQRYWEHALEELMDDRSPVQAVEEGLGRRNAQGWIQATARTVAKDHPRYGNPDGRARQNLIENFESVRDSMIALNRCRARFNNATLRRAGRTLSQWKQAGGSLRTWLTTDPSEPIHKACQAVAALLPEEIQNGQQ